MKIKISAQHATYITVLMILLLLSSSITPLLSGNLWAADVSVQAVLQPTTFGIDENARLTVTVTGARSATPGQPTGDGLRFFSRGQSTQLQWINGQSSSSVSFTWLVQATQTGSHTIAPISIQVDGKTYTTKAITCRVTPAAAAPAPRGGQPVQPPPATRLRSGVADQIGFMRVVPKKETIYAGERLPFTLKAYFRQGMQVTIKDNPHLTGDTFILESMDKKPVQSEETVNGVPYTLLSWHGAVAAVKQGKYPLEFSLATSLLVRTRRQHPSSMFGSPLFNDPFFDDFFGGYTQKNITLLSPQQEINVHDLPTTGRPPEFSGAIGSFSLSVKARPTTVAPGDPITLHMIIQGNGSFDRVKAPLFTGKAADWKTYPPSAGKQETTGNTTTKEFEQAIIPLDKAVDHIPPVRFSYFDPETGKYIRLQSDPIALNMQTTATTGQVEKRETPTAGKQPAAQPQQPQPEGKALSATRELPAPIHTSLGRTVTQIRPLYLRLWFQVLLIASLLVFLTAMLLRRRNRKMQAHPEIIEQKKIAADISTLVREAQAAMQEQEENRFLQLCRNILQVYFGFIWQIEPKAISAADLEQRLPADSPLPHILRQAEHAAYSGEKTTAEEMQRIYETLRQEVNKQ